MAREVGAEHHELLLTVDDLIDFLPTMVRLQDEPIADPVCVPVYYVSKLARDNGVIVCQVGEGADELFWGYPGWKTALRVQQLDDLPVPRALKRLGLGALRALGRDQDTRYEWLRRASLGQPVFWGGAEAFTDAQKRRLLSPRLREKFAGITSWDVLRPIRERFEAKAWEPSNLHWMTYLDLNLRLPELLLMRVDKMSMGVSLEGRVPFLDHEFVSLALSIPSAVKTRGRRAQAHPEEGRAGADPRRADRPAQAGVRRPGDRVAAGPPRRSCPPRDRRAARPDRLPRPESGRRAARRRARVPGLVPAQFRAVVEGVPAVTDFKQMSRRHWNANPCGGDGFDELGYATPEYFRAVASSRYETSDPWIRTTVDFAAARGKKVLEIGFGIGTDLVSFAKEGAEVCGIDITEEHFRLARRNFECQGLRAELKLCDAAAIDYPANSFDIVYSLGVLHHTPDTIRCVSEAYRVLKPGGRLILALYHTWSAFHIVNVLLDQGLLHGKLRRLGYRGLLSTVERGADGVGVAPLVKTYDKRQLRCMLADFSAVELKVAHFRRDHVPHLGRFIPTSWEEPLGARFGWYLVAFATK